jgi:predicted GTPase
MANIAQIKPGATVIQARSTVSVDKPQLVQGKRVLVIEDGPTLTHGKWATARASLRHQDTAPARSWTPEPQRKAV